MIEFTNAALDNLFENGTDPAEDLARLLSGDVTIDGLLAAYLDGADEDRERGWRDYVAAMAVGLEHRDKGGIVAVEGGLRTFETTQERDMWIAQG